ERVAPGVDGKQHVAAVGEDVGLGIFQHLAIVGLDHEPALQPFDVEGGELAAPARIEADHADAFAAHSSARCATAAVAASRSLSSNGVMRKNDTVPASRQRPLTL